MVHICEVHDGDAALVPGLDLDVPTGNRNERAVVRNTVLAVTLRSRQLVVASEAQLVIRQAENRIGAPFVRIVRAATRTEASAPLICKHDFFSIIRKRGRVPIRIVRIVYRVHTLWMDWV